MPSWPSFGPVRKVYAVDGSGADEPEYWEDKAGGVDIPEYLERQRRERPDALPRLHGPDPAHGPRPRGRLRVGHQARPVGR